MSNYYEKVDWEVVRDECQYPEGDDNGGFIYGLYYLDNNCQIVDAEWFKSELHRLAVMTELEQAHGYKEYETPFWRQRSIA